MVKLQGKPILFELVFLCIAVIVTGVVSTGNLVSFVEQYTRSTTEIEALVAAQSDSVQSSIVLGYFQVKYPVSDYLLTYEDDKDEDKSKFTAKILVPSGTQNCSTFIYFHESEVFHKAVPTERPICDEAAFAGLCMFNNLAATYAITASAGYCVVLPDLEGLGNSASYPGIHPYGQLGKQNNHVGILLDAYEEFLLKKSIVGRSRLYIGGIDEGANYAIQTINYYYSENMDPLQKKKFPLLSIFIQDIVDIIDLTQRNVKILCQHTPGTRNDKIEWNGLYAFFGHGAFTNATLDTIFDETNGMRSKLQTLYSGNVDIAAGIVDTSSIKTILNLLGSDLFKKDTKFCSSALTSGGFRERFKTDSMKSNPGSTYKFIEENSADLLKSIGGDSGELVATAHICENRNSNYSNFEVLSGIEQHVRTNRQFKLSVDPANGDQPLIIRQKCYMSILAIIGSTNWNAVEDELYGPPRAIVTSTDYRIPLEYLGMLAGILTIWILGEPIISAISMKLRNKPVKITGPFSVWIIVMTRCPAIVLILGTLLPVYVSYLGMEASNWTITVDSDFANYLSAATVMKRELTAFQYAKASAGLKHKPPKVKTRRRLAAKSAYRVHQISGGLDVFYHAKDLSKGIFTEDCIKEIKKFEDKLQKFADYKTWCLKAETNDEEVDCIVPLSPMNLFYSKGDGNGGNSSEVGVYTGGNILLDIEFVLKAMVETGVFWFSDNDFGPKNLKSELTRSHFDFGYRFKRDKTFVKKVLALKKKGNYYRWLEKLYDEFLATANEKEFKHVTMTFFEGNTLLDYEINEALMHDVLFALGSFSFVGFFVLMHLESPFLAFVAMTSILLSFPAGYAIFYIYFGIKSMMLLNFVALFLIMGIGADDAFVLFDTYSQAEAVLGSKSTPVQRMKWAYKEAGSAMLVTTVTTAGSFYANLFSAVRVVKEFGMFMGTVVVWNYINVMIIFPAAILTWEYSCWACKMKFIKKKCCGKKNTNASITPEDTVSGLVRFKMSSKKVISKRKLTRNLSRLHLKFREKGHQIDVSKLSAPEKCCHGCYTNCLHKFRFPLILFTICITLGFGALAAASFKLASGTPTIFLENRNLGRFAVLMKTKFAGSTPADLEMANKAFPRDVTLKEENCPGTTVDGSVQCNKHGTCDSETFRCNCFAGWAGDGCDSIAISVATPKITPLSGPWGTNLTISASNALNICYRTSTLTCNNDGTCPNGATQIEGTSGIIPNLVENITYFAMGCTDVSTGNAHSSISEIEITIETTTAAAPTFIGGSSKIKKSYGRTVTINSATANYICYDDTNDPVCNATSLTCSIGTMIAGTTGETVGITSSVTMKAIACGDGKGHLDSAVISQEVELVTKTVGDVTVDVTSLEDVDTQGKNVTLSAVDADNICYYAHEEGESAEPTCGNDGTCTGEAKTISGDFGMVTIRKHNTVIKARGCIDTAYGDKISVNIKSYTISVTNLVGVPVISGIDDNNQIGYGTTVNIKSVFAGYICYTINGTEPSCTSNAATCGAGSTIKTGSFTSPTYKLEINTDSLTTVGNYIKAIGCGARRNGRDTDSAIYSTTSTISFKPVDAGAIEFAYDSNSNFDADGKILHGGQVILTSTNAVRICYRVGSSGDDPTCHSNGTCVGDALSLTGSTVTTNAITDTSETGTNFKIRAIGCRNKGQNAADAHSSMRTKQLDRVSVQLTEPTVTGSAAGAGGKMQSDSSTPTNYYFTVAADVTLGSTAQTILNFDNDQIIPKGFCYLDDGNTPECNNDGLGTSCNAGKGTYIDAAGSSTVSISGISSTKEFKAIACSLHNWGYHNSQATSTAVNVNKVDKAGVPTVDITQGNVGATVTVTSTNATKICYQSATGTTAVNDPECKDDGTGCKIGKGTTITTTFSVASETTNYKLIGCMNTGPNDYNFHSEVSSVIKITTIVTAEDPTIYTVNGGTSTSQYVLTDNDKTGIDGQITLTAPSTYNSGITTKQCYTKDGATNPGCDESGNCDSNSLTYSNGIIIQGDDTISNVIIKAINCLPSPNGNSNIITIGTYTPVFQPQPIRFDGSLNTDSKEIADGSSMQLEASHASHICYTVDNANDPVCTTTGCSTGTKISSKISPPQPVYRGNAIGTIKGPTQALGSSDGIVKAIACTDNVNDTPATGVSSKPYTIATITAGAVNMVGVLYSETDSNTVRKGGAVTLSSIGAVRICYSIGSADAACGTNNCTAGTEISASEGDTSAISAATSITAIGCADVNSDKATGSFTLEVVQPVNMLAEVKSGTSTNTLKYGGRVQLSSSNAKFICYTSDGSTPSCAACNDDESCASDGNDACTTGSVRLTTEYTSIFKSIDKVTVKAIGCHTAQSTATETEFDIEATQATAPELTKVDIHSEDKIQIFIEAETAVNVCWSHNASNVFCHQNGTCGGHIWPVNIIQATNEGVSTVDLGKFPSGMDFYAISCGRSGISGSSDSIVVHENFTLTPVTTQPPMTTTATSTIAPTQRPTTATPELATTTTPELATTTTPTCPNGCSGNGDCDEFGECQCMKGFDREDCSVKLVPLGDSVEFAILFGIDNTGDGYDKENNTIYTFNPKFDMKTKLAQSFLLEVCQRARADVTLKARPDWPQQCWIQKLAENVEVFPISPAFFPMAIEQFFVQTKGVYDPDIETHGEKYKGKIIWAALRFRINVQLSVGAFEIMPYYEKWKKFLDDEINPIAPPEVGYGKIVSAHFTSSDTEIEIIYSTIASFLTSNGICLVAIIVFTGDLLISGYAMLAIMMIVITLLGFLFGIVGFTFGAIEAVGVTIFVGMSVDYCLHLAHGYHSSTHSTRREKIQDALTHLGVSIVMGAITTGGAAIFLFFCYLYLFYQLGMMMFFNTIFALYFSLVFLSAMLVAAGPNGATCDVYAWPMIVIGLICGKNGNKKIDMTESQAKGVLLAAAAFEHGEHNHDDEDENAFEMI